MMEILGKVVDAFALAAVLVVGFALTVATGLFLVRVALWFIERVP